MPSAAFRFHPASAALLLALGLGATCCGTSVQAQGAWASGLDAQDALPGSASALPAGVRRLPDVPYGPDARQRIDVYLPAHPHPGRAPMLPWLTTAILAARAHGLDVIDGVYNDLKNEAGFLAALEGARAGRWVRARLSVSPSNPGGASVPAVPAAARALWETKLPTTMPSTVL